MSRELHFQHAGVRYTVTVAPDGDAWRVTIGPRTWRVMARPGPNDRLVLDIDGARTLAHVAQADALRCVHCRGAVWNLERVSGIRTPAPKHSEQSNSLTAAMPGRVLDVLVAAGQTVTRGQTLVLLEAMKMELRLTAPCDGRVASLRCAAGEIVARGQLLLEIAPT